MPYKRQLRRGVLWMASYYVPIGLLPESERKSKTSTQRIYEPAADAGYPNTKPGAAQLEARRKREIGHGTYVYQAMGEHTATTWVVEWTDGRTTRDKQMDRRRVENHFLPYRDFANKKLGAFRPTDFKEWAKHGKTLVDAKKLSAKTFGNAYGVVHTMFHDAVAREKIAFNPCVLSRGDLPMRRKKRGRRYEDSESRELVWCKALPTDVRMLFCLLSYNGERVGEACGHVWSDLDRGSEPLAALVLERQYNNEPLKTSTDAERPRVVPVHPELLKALDWWESEGWAEFYGRPPRPSDPIIPNRFKRGHHTRKSIYHQARDAFEAAGLTWKGHHACRHSFTTTARRLGAPELWIERITHNAAGSIVDHYTHTEWDPLCDVVMRLPWRLEPAEVVQLTRAVGDTNGDRFQETAEKQPPNRAGEGIRNLPLGGKQPGNARKFEKLVGEQEPQFPGRSGSSEPLAPPVAKTPAELRRAKLEKLAEIDPKAARPGLAVVRGVDAALRLGAGYADARVELLEALQDGAEALQSRRPA